MRIGMWLAVLLLCATSASAQVKKGTALNISANTFMEFDSNMRGRQVPAPGMRYSIGPRFRLDYGYRRFGLDLDYIPNLYGGTTGIENRISNRMIASTSYDFNERFRLVFSDSFRNVRGFDGLFDDAADRDNSASSNDFINTVTLGMAYRFARTASLTASGGYTVSNRESKTQFDARFYNLSLAVRWRPAQNDIVSVGSAYAYNRFIPPENPDLEDQSGSINQTFQFFARWSRDLSRSTKFSVRIAPTVVVERAADPVTEFDARLDQILVDTSSVAAGITTGPNGGNFATAGLYLPDPRDIVVSNRVRNLSDETDDNIEFLTMPARLLSPALSDCTEFKSRGPGGGTFRSLDDCSTSFANLLTLGSGINNNRDLVQANLVHPSGTYQGPAYQVHDQNLIYPRSDGRGLCNPAREDPNDPTSPQLSPAQCEDGVIVRPVWGPDFDNSPFTVNLDGTRYDINTQIYDEPFSTGKLSYLPGQEPSFDRVVTSFRLAAEVELSKRWNDAWSSVVSYSRRELPDAGAGGGTSVDTFVARTHWRATRRWRFNVLLSYRNRVSTNATPEILRVAGALVHPVDGPVYGNFQDELNNQIPARFNWFPEAADDTTPKATLFRPQAPGDPNDITRTIPSAVGLALGPDRLSINAQTLGLSLNLHRRLSRRSNVSMRFRYTHQTSEGRFFRTFDRYAVRLDYTYTFDPWRF